MDVNSSQDNLAGYKAVLLGAAHVPRGIPMMTTSAGTVRPAKFVVMGSGVEPANNRNGEATGSRGPCLRRSSCGEGTDRIRIGGRFIHVDGMEDFEDESGYAKPLTPRCSPKVNDTVCDVASDADVIITTATIFGRPAPITVPTSALASFKRGAVVVDMNADVGGNCESTVPGRSPSMWTASPSWACRSLPGTLANTASMLYSNNLTTFALSIIKDGCAHDGRG